MQTRDSATEERRLCAGAPNKDEVDWEFINIRGIGENQTYPYLRTVPAGDIKKDRIVNLLDLCIVSEPWMAED